jgi:HEAT repeat protein
LIALARHRTQSSERYARSQVADALGSVGQEHVAESEALLMRYVHDGDAYVSRLALVALGRLKSPLVESIVQRAWDTNDEYQRMAVLDALRSAGSPLPMSYLTRASQDGRKYLVAYAEELRSSKG